jgi:hypothetical protein
VRVSAFEDKISVTVMQDHWGHLTVKVVSAHLPEATHAQLVRIRDEVIDTIQRIGAEEHLTWSPEVYITAWARP